jgi:hypothetical protein
LAETAVNNIARWNGTGWSTLGTGITTTSGNPNVFALGVHNDGSGSALYAGGSFNTAGGVSVNNIAKWNGTSWSALGSGTNSQVRALHSFGGALYAGGWFTTAGGISVNKIAKWSSGAWSALAEGVSTGEFPAVHALNSYDGYLIVGGVFGTAGTTSAQNIARWSGTSWSAMGNGMNGPVVSLGAVLVGSG